MTADELTVAGRRFRTRKDYEAALRDEKKIKSIRSAKDLNSPKQLYELFSELKSGAYRFETIVGTDFDDEIYEKIEELKKKGITAENAESLSKGRLSGTRAGKKPHGKAEKKKNVKKADNSADLKNYDKAMQKQIIAELEKREKRRKLILALASLVAIGCFTYYGVYYYFNLRTNIDYEQLADLKGSDALTADSEKAGDNLLVHRTNAGLPDILDEYKTLYEKNKKLIGWLKIDDTNIDYPVMQTSDNEYYLDHNYNQEYDKNGSIFLDYNCRVYPRSTNMIVYGHHMKSGSMFGNLQKYAKESYGKEHSIIQFDSIYEKAAYQVMYVFRSQVYNESDAVFKYYQFIDANSEGEFDYYMNEMAALSLYDTGVTASYGDSLLTLSTCDSSQTDGRFVVVAKRIS